MSRSTYRERLHALDDFLTAHRQLWLPQPFITPRPDWCHDYPALCRELLALDDSDLDRLSSDGHALIRMLGSHIPPLLEIPALTALPESTQHADNPIPDRLSAGVPGRKWEQVTALYRSMVTPQLPLTEWCGGKGHLGRLLSRQWKLPVTTIERDPVLTAAGKHAAARLNLQQEFRTLDVLSDPVTTYLQQHHTIALHACGDLHRSLVAQLIDAEAPCFAIVPCCYHLGRSDSYTPFNIDLKLRLPREALRLAVNETATAHHYEIGKRNLDMAYKLGFLLLKERYCDSDGYRPFMPVPKAWLAEGYAGYCSKLAEREGVNLPAGIDWSDWEQRGHARCSEVLRLQLLRQGFRRALEIWLVMDMAVHLEEYDYRVNVSRFCDSSLTPRNILIEGRR